MSGITQKSGVLAWTTDKIEEAPSSGGIYVLRSLPAVNGIIYLRYSDDVRQSLKQHLIGNDIPEVSWFDWYQIDDKGAALKIVEDWLVKYAPKYNKG